jgi:PAS domain S-box-containing protein
MAESALVRFRALIPGGWRLPFARAWNSYAVALTLVAVIVVVRAVIDRIAPGVAYFVLLLPAVVFAGVFCGTIQGITAALVGSLTFAVLFQGASFFAPPLRDRQHIDFILFLMASVSVLWATHRMRAAASAAAAVQARLEAVFQQLPCAAAIIDAPGGRVLLRTDQFGDVPSRKQGVPSAEDPSAFHAVHPDGRIYAADDYPVVRAMAKGEVTRGEPLHYKHPSGRSADLEVYAAPIRIGGRIAGAVEMAFDVTKRRAAELRLAAQEASSRALSERLRAALDAGALGTWELDLATDSLFWDEQAAAMFGLPRTAVSMARSEAVHFFEPEDYQASAAAFRQALEAEGPYATTIRGRTVLGDPRWFLVRGAVLAGDRKVVGVLQDITGAKLREIQLQEAINARDLLMREADHRIKNSLQLVASLLRMQAMRVENEDAKAALKSAQARIDSIADGHVAFQQSQSFETVAVDTMIREICTRLGLLDPAITIRQDIAGPLALHSDLAIPLGLIFSEIVTNALRHAFNPGESGAIDISAYRRDGAIVIEAADDGRGFFEDATLRQGLGTTIIKTLCARINAETLTVSELGEGTRVTIRVPAPH